MEELRRSLTKVGGEYKVYKNTLVKLATTGGPHESLHALLEGPTAIAFVTGEVSAVAKALRDYARTNPHLIVKGGMFGPDLLSTSDLTALADLPSRDVLLSRLAGGIAAPLQQLAGLLQALPRNLAYGISALIEKMPAAESPAAESPAAESPAAEPPAAEPPAGAESASDPGATAAEGSAEAPAEESEAPATETAQAPAAGTAETAETETTATDETEETKEQSENG